MRSPSPESLKRGLALAPAMAVAVGAAGFLLYQWSGARPLWVDEEMIAINIRDRGLRDLAGPLWLGQSAPLGWLVVQRLMLATAGTGEQALRFLPVLFGAGTLAATVWAGRRWMTAAGAFVLTVLVAFGLWMSFYPLELKHYSADAFWGLVVPALAAWALDARETAVVRRRGAVWWVIAALAHWLSNGGLFATPGSALVLAAVIWRRHGFHEAARFALAGAGWLVSFALYYTLSLGHTHGNPYLRQFWIEDFLPPGAGFAGAALWFWLRLEPLAQHPAGTVRWMLLWLAALAGFAVGKPRALAAILATLPLTAFALAAAGLVPLRERFALWRVPALYAGIAMLAVRAAGLAREGARDRRAVLLAAALPIAALVLLPASDIVARGLKDFRENRSPATNRGLDDREAVRWVLAQRKEGDAILTTRLGWPALWWYGGLRPHGEADAAAAGGFFQAGHRRPGGDCRPDQLRDALRLHTRALVYVGFPDMPAGYGTLLLQHLDRLGAITYYREIGDGFVAIVELHTAGAEGGSLDLLPSSRLLTATLDGCIAVSPALLW
ncbi:MAG TPA: hypothetical protein VFZ36_07210 [Vicinamibacterales bacterium]